MIITIIFFCNYYYFLVLYNARFSVSALYVHSLKLCFMTLFSCILKVFLHYEKYPFFQFDLKIKLLLQFYFSHSFIYFIYLLIYLRIIFAHVGTPPSPVTIPETRKAASRTALPHMHHSVSVAESRYA